MANILTNSLQSNARTCGVPRSYEVCFVGTTAANGDITLGTEANGYQGTYNGTFAAPTRSTNTYTITIGSFDRLLACNISTGAGIVINSITPNPSAGTIVVVFNATVVSTTISAIIKVSRRSI
jgi:hypothetical protein